MRIEARTRRQVAAWGAIWLGIAAMLVACGGGGGGGAPPEPEKITLGEMSATSPTRVTRSWLNPLGAPATVTAVPASGPFAFDAADLPAQAGALGTVNLGLVFTPPGPGEATGLVGLRFEGGGEVAVRMFEITATGEALVWTVTPDPVDFGDVLPGDSRELEITLRNGSQRSPVTLTSGNLPEAYAFVTDPFPLAVGPGQSRTFAVRFAPTLVADHGGLLRLGPTDVGGPVDIALWANSSGAGEQIVDLGTQSLFGGDTPVLEVEVPADAISVTFEGRMGTADVVGLRMLEGPGGRVYENTSATGPVLWIENEQSFSIHLPSSDRSQTQLVPGGGTYRFQLYRVSGSGTTMQVRVILERRPSGGSTTTVLPLNVFLAKGITPTAATASTNAYLQDVLTQVGQILGAQDVQLGDIAYHDIANPAFDQVAQGEEEQLFQLSAQAAKDRCNLFLVKQVWGGQLLGLSGAIDGAKRRGDINSGVVSLYLEAQAGALAAVIAHELCHYLGLWHTVESTGAHDPILDTPECPPSGTDAVCSVPGGGLLMHWEGLGGKILTAGQGLVIRGHACCHPPSQVGALHAKPAPWQPDEGTLEFLRSLPPGWCGTARR